MFFISTQSYFYLNSYQIIKQNKDKMYTDSIQQQNSIDQFANYNNSFSHKTKKQLQNKYKIQIQNMKKMVVIFFGHTQSAKSSMIRDLTGDTSVVCGNGAGSSTTTAIRIHKPIRPKLSDLFIFMDTIGMGDNSLRFTPQQIREQIQSNVIALSDAQKCDEVQAIAITEPLRDGAYQLPNTLQTITQIFGKLPNKSIVVLGTKSHNEHQDDIITRQNGIRQVMRDFRIPLEHYIRFGTTYKRRDASQIDQRQYVQLQALLGRCQKIDAKSIKEKHKRILERAKQIQVEKTQVKQHPYTHTWVGDGNQGSQGNPLAAKIGVGAVGIGFGAPAAIIAAPILSGLFGGSKKVQVHSETRYHQTRHEPPMDYCYSLALEEYNTQVRKSLLQNR